MRARREALAHQMVRLVDPDELHEHLDRLAGPLGLDAGQLELLRGLDGDELALYLRARLGELRKLDRATRARAAEARALGGAARLARTARWDGPAVYLEPELVLTELPAHPTAKVIGFDIDGDATWVSKKKLRQARRALRGFDDIRVYIGRTGLCLRWRGGRGGLNLRAHTPDRGEETLIVRLHGPAEVHPAPEATSTRPGLSRPSRGPQRPGAWLGEILPAVLADLGLSD